MRLGLLRNASRFSRRHADLPQNAKSNHIKHQVLSLSHSELVRSAAGTEIALWVDHRLRISRSFLSKAAIQSYN